MTGGCTIIIATELEKKTYLRLQGLIEEDVQWSIDSVVVTKDMVVRTENVPYLVFA